MGLASDKVIICQDGDSVILSDKGLKRGESVPSDYIYINGTVGDLDESVLVDRRILGTHGFVSAIVALAIEGPNAMLLREPEIVSKGWVEGNEGDQLRKEAMHQVRDAVENAISDGVRTRPKLEKVVRRSLGRFVSNRTRLRPVIVPVVLGAHEE
jgi:ribonuclease J